MRRLTPIRLAIVALALLAALLPQHSPARSQDVFHLLKDMNTSTTTDVHHATEAIAMGGKTYFISFDGTYNYELWRTDGTASGTTMVMDFPHHLYHSAFQLMPAIDRFYFMAESIEYDACLWVSDGTTEGTHIVLDSKTGQPVSLGDYGAFDREKYADLPFATNGTQLFITSGYSLIWKTDGTTAGTAQLPLTMSVNKFITNNGKLYIVDKNGDLWAGDGTAVGTQKLSPIMTFRDPRIDSDINPYAIFANKLYYFQKLDYSNPTELWATDGTPEGTEKIADLHENDPESAITANESGLWIKMPASNMLWKSDGTTAGTIPIATLPNSMNTDSAFLKGKLYFILLASNGIELWSSGGTAGNTAKVATLSTTRQSSQIRQVGSKLIMCGLTTVECWASDGTAAGTAAITSAGTRLRLPIAAQQGSALIAPVGGTSTKGLIWKSDGTAAGTAAITSITMGHGTGNRFAQRVGGFTYFASSDGNIWKSDGTSAGTTPQKELSAKIPSGASLKQLLNVNGKLIIATSTALLASDGTAAGTTTIKNVTDNNNWNEWYVVFGQRLLIKAGPSSLWASDGTKTGTIELPTDGGVVSNITLNGAEILFSTTTDSGKTLWKTDGTAAGTSTITKLPTTSTGGITIQGSKIFWLDPTGSQIELWTYNTVLKKAEHLTDITPTITARIIDTQSTDSSIILFIASLEKTEIWRSDGTTAGTIKLASTSVQSFERANTGNIVFFTGLDTAHGNELWRTDGTVAGTFMLKDINPGLPSSYPEYLTIVGSTIYFSAYSPATGMELWRSDGTTEGTALYADIAPGPYSSNVRPDLGNFGTELWVEADTLQYGTEPYIVNISVGSKRLYLPLAAAQ